MDRIWGKVCAGVGKRFNRYALYFGYPECNITVPVVVVSFAGRHHLVEVVREGKKWDLRILIRPLLIVVHKFMNLDELNTPLGRERLRACVFRLPVEGKMVSMCEMNATSLRRQLNLEANATRAAGL
ncbi:MAG: hypothetical protein ACE5HV_01890 [Acidobacteriota bacterium]